MTRALLLLPFAALAAGCYVAPAQPRHNDITLYWDFERFVLGGTAVAYDTNLSPGGGDRTCPQSGVDSIDVLDEGGRLIVEAVPCIYQGVQGVIIPGFTAGTNRIIVDGYRGSIRVYSVTADLAVVDQGANQFTVRVPGVPGDLAVFADFYDATGSSVAWTLCGSGAGGANVQTLAYQIADQQGTVVAQGTTACTDPAGLSFIGSQALDLDRYFIRLQAYRTGVADPILDSRTTRFTPFCSDAPFNHYGNDTGANGWAVGLYDVTGNATLCQ